MRKYVTVALVASLLFTCFTVFLSFDTCRAVGNIIYVNASGGANYTTMQEAVDAAEPGDEIFVYNGEYHENVVITKNLILTGQSKDDTTINGDKNDHHVVYANGSDGKEIEFQISGFTIKNAGGTGKDCIALSYVDSGEINDNKIMNSDSDGIQLDHCSGVTISENTITDNEQCGIYLISSTDNIIRDNDQIQNNPIGIRLYLSSNNILYKNDLSSNGQNAQDSGTNSWSYNQQGNYWDDYSGEDSDEDGKGDTPYDIPGGTNQDLYPLGYFTQQPPANQKPVAYIDQPSDQSIATYGQTVSFTGHWTDSDGTVVGYNWRSNIDGQLSTSASFSTSGLSLGQHTIYLKVRDDDGEWSNEKYITITITQNQKPTANILNPTKSTYVYGETILFSGSGTDPDGEIVGYSWRSVPSGLVSSQN